jgi:hypothetical protein
MGPREARLHDQFCQNEPPIAAGLRTHVRGQGTSLATGRYADVYRPTSAWSLTLRSAPISSKLFNDHLPNSRTGESPAVGKKKAWLNCIAHPLIQMPYEEVVKLPIELPARGTQPGVLPPAGAGRDVRARATLGLARRTVPVRGGPRMGLAADA